MKEHYLEFARLMEQKKKEQGKIDEETAFDCYAEAWENVLKEAE